MATELDTTPGKHASNLDGVAEAVSDEVMATIEADEFISEHLSKIPFSFAKRFHVFLDTDIEPNELYYTEETLLSAFAEVRRYSGKSFALKKTKKEDFETLLTDSFQRDSSEAKQLMEDLGNESDLFALAEDLPDTEDLLDNEDDAPIIKLINAMLGEAIKEGASDIHIETFENQLVVRFRVDGVLREILRPNRKM